MKRLSEGREFECVRVLNVGWYLSKVYVYVSTSLRILQWQWFLYLFEWGMLDTAFSSWGKTMCTATYQGRGEDWVHHIMWRVLKWFAATTTIYMHKKHGMVYIHIHLQWIVLLYTNYVILVNNASYLETSRHIHNTCNEATLVVTIVVLSCFFLNRKWN